MGRRDDPLAVVDPELRVIGVEGLRVADSSVFPRVTNGNLNAPSIMTGEKAADHILGQGMLAPFNLGPEMPGDWRDSQRSS
jgi:choline dehydrogenase